MYERERKLLHLMHVCLHTVCARERKVKIYSAFTCVSVCERRREEIIFFSCVGLHVSKRKLLCVCVVVLHQAGVCG